MKKTCVALLATAAAIATTGAGADTYAAGTYSIAGLAKPTMTYTKVGKIPTVENTSYNGVGSLFVTYASTATTGFGSLCTGSLLNSFTVLTAAHCLSNYTEEGVFDPVTSVSFYLPSFGDRRTPGVEIYTASAWSINPLYDNATTLPDGTPPHYGDIGGGHDEALFTLSTNATGHDTYSIYTGDPLAKYTEVGTGTIGGPKGTDQGATDDYLKRTGKNKFEAYGDQIFSDVTNGVVFSDFDDGTTAHDVLGAILGINNTGVAGGDADSSPGDSGGPEFIDGQIAATTSFGITGGVFMSPTRKYPDGYCGGNSLDPYNANGSKKKTSVDTGLCTNSSVGELAGDTLAANNLDFINSYTSYFSSAGVPEPSTWAMLMVGFGAVGSVARRRKTAVRFSQAI